MAVLRTLKKVVLWSLAVVFVLVATVFAINSRDESVSPQTVRVLTAPPNPYRPSDNLYFMLAGLDAPAGGSVIEAGQAAVRAYEAKLQKGPDAFLHSVDKLTPGTLVFKGKVACYRRLTGAIWREVAGRKAEINQLLAANRELYQRYRALRSATGYYETGTPSVYAMPFFPPRQLRSLFLADFALRMQSGNRAEQSAALADMADDLQVWRTMLTGYGSLISKMVAVAYLRQDFLLIGNMIADPTVALSVRRAAMGRLVMPFPTRDWRIGSGFSYENRMMTRELVTSYSAARQKEADRPLWKRVEHELSETLYLFKIHATENLLASNTLKLIAIMDGPPRLLEKSMSTYADEADCLSTPKISCLYNPLGKILIAIDIPAYEEYPLRAYDVAALQRMVKLAYEIRVQRVETAEIPRFIKQHPEWSTHPVDGKEFAFNPATGRLSMERLGNQSKTRYFVIPVWKRGS